MNTREPHDQRDPRDAGDARDNDAALKRLAALVRAEQAHALADADELRRLEIRAEIVGAPTRVARRTARVAGLGAAMAALAALAAIALWVAWPRSLSFEVAGVPRQVGMKVLAGGQQPLPLRFSDGSVVTLTAGSEGEVVELSAQGAEIRLHAGRLEATVVHNPRTRWAVGVGPYQVQVTGTRFSAEWLAGQRQLRLLLKEGSVIVRGPLLGGGGLPVRQGQQLSIGIGEQRVSLAPTSDGAPPPPEPPPATPVVPATSPTPPPEATEWKRLALGARPRQAYAAAARVGIAALCETLPAPDLLLLADAARFAGASGSAQQAFQSLRARFPDDRRASDAVFGLGVLALDAQQRPAVAVTRFKEYLQRWPSGALAREARGRVMEALVRVARATEARRAAGEYLRLYPDGPHAPFARRLLD